MATESAANDFQRGDDFISFGGGEASTSSGPSSAGPSRLPLSSADRAILDKKAGLNKSGGKAKAQGQGQGQAREKKNKQEKKSTKGKGKEKEKDASSNQAGGSSGKKRARGADDPVGPKNLKEERRAAERHAPWTDLVDWESCQDPAEMLNAEIDAFYRHVSPTKAEYEVRLFMIELITRAIMRLWPDAEVTPFGSWQTQLYLPHGDIDLVVSTKHLNEANKGRMLAELARAMRMAHLTDVVAIIAKARVPIIKFVTTEGKLNVDISLNQTNGISAGQIINQYLDVLPGCRQLILVVKAFLSQRSMNEVYTGGLGSYAVICLVISFLQLHPKLRRADLDPEQNLGTLLVEFFELYGRNFSYDEVGISIRRGGSYFTKRSRNWYKQTQPYLLCIEDPQDRDNDISSGSFGIRQVKSTLSGAYEMLQARLFERAEQLSGRRSGRYQNSWDPDEMSILTGVMGITKETQKHRRELQRLHEEGRLQRMLSIPPHASPEGYVQNYKPPLVIGMKRSTGSIRLDGTGTSTGTSTSRGPDGEGPPAKKKRKSTDGLAAVMLDDEIEEGEIGWEMFDEDEDDEEDDSEDSDDDDSEGEKVRIGGKAGKQVKTKAGVVDEEDDDDESVKDDEHEMEDEDEEEDEVDGALLKNQSDHSASSGVLVIESSDEEDDPIPSIPATTSVRQTINRIRADSTVSQDSDDFEIQPAFVSRANAEDDSRYTVLKKGTSAKGANGKVGKTRRTSKEESVLVSDSDVSSSGSSIVPLSRPPSATERKEGSAAVTSAGSKVDGDGSRRKGGAGGQTVEGSGGVGKKEKRDFWLAKAGKRDEDEDEEDDAFGGGGDFVRL